MNEPEVPTDKGVLLSYYTRAHDAIRGSGNDCVLVLAPLLSEQAPGVMVEFMRGYKNVWIEWHPYFKWGFEGQNEDKLIGAAAAYGARVAQWTGNPLLISEWSLGTDEKSAPFADRAQFQRFASTQVAAFNAARAGWTFWSWRHSDATAGKRTGWSMRALLRDGILHI